MKYTYSYEAKDLENKKCILCGAEITEDEFEYEDYFVIFRGHSESCIAGYGCFACLKERGQVVGG